MAQASRTFAGLTWAMRVADRRAERGERRRIGDRPVGAEHEPVDADRRAASRRPRAGRRRRRRTTRARRAPRRPGRRAPRAVRPGAERRRPASPTRPSGAGARTGPTRRRRATPPASPPRTSHRGPPRRRRRVGRRRRARVHEQRGVAGGEPLQHRAAAIEPALAGERRGGQAEAGRAGVEQRVDGRRLRRGERDRAPRGERAADSCTPRWKASRSGCASAAGRLSIPSGDDGATSTRSRPSRPASAIRAAGSCARRSNAAGASPRQLQLPAVAAAAQARGVGARGQEPQQRLGPEVLVDVGRRHRPDRVHDFVDQLS